MVLAKLVFIFNYPYPAFFCSSAHIATNLEYEILGFVYLLVGHIFLESRNHPHVQKEHLCFLDLPQDSLYYCSSFLMKGLVNNGQRDMSSYFNATITLYYTNI